MSQRSSIYVIGSSNTDMVIKSGKLPLPGETVIGGDFLMNPGGKGANQAVSCARLGGKVSFVCKLGDDLFGKQALEEFRQQNINTRYVFIDPERPTGVALINVDKHGENCISVAPGANNALYIEDISQALESISEEDIVLIQLEIPLETVMAAILQSNGKGARVILNPAPAQELPESLYQHLYLITPNETEASVLTGIPVVDESSARAAAAILIGKGCQHVIITLGNRGALVYSSEYTGIIPATVVEAVDTTAAGDCFNGALAVALSENNPLKEAAEFACKAASISVTRMGAQSSIPLRREIQ